MWDYLPVFRLPEGFFLAPLAILGVWWSARPRLRPAVIFSSLSGVRGLPVTLAQRIRSAMPYARAAGLLLILAAFCRPQLGITETRTHAEGIAIQATLDISGSMEALDFSLDGKQTSRLEAVKHVLAEFIAGSKQARLPGRSQDAIGLVAFGGFADSRCPMTLDHGALLDVVRGLETPKELHDRHGQVLNEAYLREEQATAIGDAITVSVDRLESLQAKSKAIVLLSDGVNNAGVCDPEDAIALAKSKGIKIYAIGIGQAGAAPFPFVDRYGKRVLKSVVVEFDPTLLKKAAETTGGKYFHATDTEALRSVYEEIDKLERTETERAIFTEYRELYVWPLLAGLLLLLADGGLGYTRFRTLP